MAGRRSQLMAQQRRVPGWTGRNLSNGMPAPQAGTPMPPGSSGTGMPTPSQSGDTPASTIDAILTTAYGQKLTWRVANVGDVGLYQYDHTARSGTTSPIKYSRASRGDLQSAGQNSWRLTKTYSNDTTGYLLVTLNGYDIFIKVDC